MKLVYMFVLSVGLGGMVPAVIAMKRTSENKLQEPESKRQKINALSKEEVEQLIESCKKGSIEAVVELLDKGGDVNTCDEKGASLLSLAAKNKHIEIVKILFDRDARGTDGLHYAAKYGHVDLCKSLSSKNDANVNIGNSSGKTPLHFAAGGGYKDVCDFLLSKGANVNAEDSYGYTPLHYAAEAGHVGICRTLLANKARVDAKEWGAAPLHLAAQGNSVGVCSLLLSYGANIDEPCYFGRPPLHNAVESDSIDVGAFLLSMGAAVDMLDGLGNTYLHEKKLSADFCKLLLKYNANLNMCNYYGCTPLYYHIVKNCKDEPEKAEKYCDLFLSKGANMKLLPMPSANLKFCLGIDSNDLSFTDALLKRKEREIRHSMLLAVVVKKKIIIDDNELDCEKIALGALRSYIANLGGMIPSDLVDKGGNNLLLRAIKAGNFEIAKYIVATFPLLLLKKNNEGNNGLGMLANVHGKYKNDAGYNEFKGACLRIALR